MNKKYKVKIDIEREDVYLSITHNGYQWASIRINDSVSEIPLIVSALQSYISKLHGLER